MSGTDTKTDLQCHVLQITSDVAFTALVGVDGDGAEIDMTLAINNNLDAVTAPATIGAPDLHRGGYIKTITLASGELLYHTLPDTRRG